MARFVLLAQGMRTLITAACSLGLVATACSDDSTSAGTAGPPSPLSATCVERAADIPAGALRCGLADAVDCRESELGTFYVTAAELGQTACGQTVLSVSTASVAGGRLIEVRDALTADLVCTATVALGTGTSTTPRTVELWPPNHRWVEVTADECAGSIAACGGSDFRWTEVLVDEPRNDRGDGNTEPDVMLGCGIVSVRAERQGPGDGRVYRLGYEYTTASGTVSAGYCDVTVPKSHNGDAAVWSGLDRRISPDNSDCEESPNPCESRLPYHERLNTGPLPAECTKVQGRAVGTDGAVVNFGTKTATITEWRSKARERGQYISFDLTLTSTPAWLSVKAGPDVFGVLLDGVLDHSWSYPADSDREARAISSVVLCDSELCEETPPSSMPDAGVQDGGASPDAGATMDAGGSDSGFTGGL